MKEQCALVAPIVLGTQMDLYMGPTGFVFLQTEDSFRSQTHAWLCYWSRSMRGPHEYSGCNTTKNRVGWQVECCVSNL